ncbi:hypothetical protein [Brucella tritici]|uniref:hypothetical protein n=1 Tax=Brucella tritici TaxID=94626 RepID=UPI0039A3B4C5
MPTAHSLPSDRFPAPAFADLPDDLRERIQQVQEKSGFVPNRPLKKDRDRVFFFAFVGHRIERNLPARRERPGMGCSDTSSGEPGLFQQPALMIAVNPLFHDRYSGSAGCVVV